MKNLIVKYKWIFFGMLIVVVCSIVLMLLFFNTTSQVSNDKNNNSNSNSNVVDEEDQLLEHKEDDLKEADQEITEDSSDDFINEEDGIEHETNDDQNSSNNSTDGSQELPKDEEVPKDEGDISIVVDPMKSANNELILSIKNNYGVNVSYGKGTYFTDKGISAIITSDEDEVAVNGVLKGINYSLSTLPRSIINTLINNNGYSFQIFKDLPGTASGYATSQVYGDHRIVLDLTSNYQSKLVYHETFHIMELYMYYKNNRNNPFVDWNSFNPSSFSYGSGDSLYTWTDKVSDIADVDFVSDYAKSSASEDRAELFADLCFRTRKYTYMNEGYGINEKAKYLDSIIQQEFGAMSGAYWQRWITY